MKLKLALPVITLVFCGLCRVEAAQQNQAVDLRPNKSVPITVQGYIRDIGCLMRFNGALEPTNECAMECARAGSPLILVTKEGVIYLPISGTIPDTSQREKLMPFVSSYVEVSGDVLERAGIKAIAKIGRASCRERV